MSGDAQPAEIDGEYRCEEKRKQKALDSKHTAPKLTTQHSAKPYGVNLSTGYFKSDGVDRQQLPTDLHTCVGESQLATVKRSKLDALDAYDTAFARPRFNKRWSYQSTSCFAQFPHQHQASKLV
jgi:hypothetical protein